VILPTGLSSIAAAAIALTLQVAGSDVPGGNAQVEPVDDGLSTSIDSELNDAYEVLVTASSYSCSKAPASARTTYERLDQKFWRLEKAAKVVLRRDVIIYPFVNSCGYFRPNKFYPSIAKAEWHLRRAESLIKKEGGK